MCGKYDSTYYERNKETIKRKLKEWRERNKDEFLRKQRIRYKRYIATHREYENERRRGKDKESRMKVIEYYSSGKNCCACCGEKEYQFLTVDHINSIGNKAHRKYGGHFYLWLVRHNFPEGFQVLCYNCNCSKGFYGKCPHQVKREENIIVT